MTDNFLSAKDISRLLNIHLSTVYRIVKEDDFPKAYIFYRHSRRWPEKEVMRWVEKKRGH
ncbi:MAG: helix-turn-helix domain-containing protein [Deltaproteobacteria bacterium]|jgi:excisionase family DNA binding protein|nr:helix-turn-helix domain-containing protein [Deltaproteobacteria bacterium]